MRWLNASTMVILIMTMVGCDTVPKKSQVNLDPIGIVVTQSGKHIDQASAKAEEIRKAVMPSPALQEKFDALSKELQAAKFNTDLALKKLEAAQVQADTFSKLYGETVEENNKLKVENEKADSAIWTRNWIIVGLVTANVAVTLWIFRKQVAALAMLISGS